MSAEPQHIADVIAPIRALLGTPMHMMTFEQRREFVALTRHNRETEPVYSGPPITPKARKPRAPRKPKSPAKTEAIL